MKMRNKLLLLSLISILGATGCSNSQEDNTLTYNQTMTEKDTDLEETLETIIASEESFVEEVVDPKTETMELINSGLIQKVYYATKDVNINIPSYLSDSGMEENIILPKLECFEVYDQVDDICLVKTNEYIGYVSTTDLEELLGTFVVVDISSQEVKLYCDNEIILTAPVVTGKPNTPSDQGIFEMYNISGPRYLIGPNYKSYVDTMMKYNGGEGLHDAEYHQHEDGFQHGWRDPSEFGGETYLTDGSHGCINMLHEDAMTVKEYVEIGTKVLVKQ